MADDPWSDFSPQAPAKTTDPWADFAPEQDTSVTASGTAKQFGVGAGKGLISIAGMGGDLRDLAGAGTDWIASKFQKPKTMSDLITQGEGAPSSFDERFSGQRPLTAGEHVKGVLRSMPGPLGVIFGGPSSGDIQGAVEHYTGPFRKPQNFTEQVAGTAGEFTPALLGGPMNAGRNAATRVAKTFATNVAAPAVASEAAGEIPGVKGSAAEPFVKAGAAITTPAALSAARSAFRPVIAPSNRQAAADYLKGEGVKDLMAGQVTGSEKQKYREATAGWKYESKRQGQLDQLTEAALGRIGETGNDALAGTQRARPRIVGQMEEATKNMIVRQDAPLTDTLVGQKFEGEILRSGLSTDQERRIFALRDNVLNQFETVARKGGVASVKDGYARFYHGGDYPASGGPRWVTPDQEYARNFRTAGTPNNVHYVDLKKGSPEEISARAWDAMDEAAGLNNVGRYRHVEMPETVAKKLKPLSASSSTPWTEMSGEAFHNLIKKGSPLDRAIDSTDAEISHWASRIKSSILDAAERTAFRQGTREGVGNRQALADLQTSRRQYANLVAIEKAMSRSGEAPANGTLTPAAVFRAATSRDTLDYAKGRGDFNKLAQASNLLMQGLPQSGTAPRLMAQLPAKTVGAGIGSIVGTAGAAMAGLSLSNPLAALAAAPVYAGVYLAPKAQNAFVMSKRGQYLAGNRPAGSQPYPGLTNEEQLRRLLLLSRPAIASSQNEYGR